MLTSDDVATVPPQALRDLVDTLLECESISASLLAIAEQYGSTPLLVETWQRNQVVRVQVLDRLRAIVAWRETRH